ncbi:diguanylate cyclase [Alicyclobacillus hesperidum URH17-3-68]|uniref:diguanylate cyclase n=1 Tax=Alicyclobacillus hesperidum TaxID=89784 RepID=UPI000281C415|nr:diguanylate cyclase [Alicyclobacillus hesperidum]EJY54634.1 diguanylate cyclase [Alicyclobacillus hesperidum URH17-3-68]
MIGTFFSNACIVFTLMVIGFLPYSRLRARRLPTTLDRLLTGLAAGVMGVLLMLYALPVPNSKLILDLRHLPVVTCALFLGPSASLVAGLVEGIGRVAIFGLNQTSLLAALNMLLVSAIAPILARIKRRLAIRVLVVNVYALTQISALVVWLMPTHTQLAWVFLTYWIVSLAAGYGSAWLMTQLFAHFRRQRELEQMSSVDFLTGLNNTRHFDLVINELAARAATGTESLSILAIDIDHFKSVNDTYGHPAGDTVLQQLAEVLQTCTGSRDIVSRNGGEEFTVLMPASTLIVAQEMAERIRATVERRDFLLPNGESIHITVSLGVACLPESTVDTSAFLQLADDALYTAKKRGRNRVCIASP